MKSFILGIISQQTVILNSNTSTVLVFYDSGFDVPLDSEKVIIPPLSFVDKTVVAGTNLADQITYGRGGTKKGLTFTYYGNEPRTISNTVIAGVNLYPLITYGIGGTNVSTSFVYYGDDPREALPEKTITGSWEFDSFFDGIT